MSGVPGPVMETTADDHEHRTNYQEGYSHVFSSTEKEYPGISAISFSLFQKTHSLTSVSGCQTLVSKISLEIILGISTYMTDLLHLFRVPLHGPSSSSHITSHATEGLRVCSSTCIPTHLHLGGQDSS